MDTIALPPRPLELLAPARTADIGMAAMDCGADAVYIAGPAFGARQAAGNPVEEVARLCAYAHRFGGRVYVTFNTLLYQEELSEARALLAQLCAAGVDAFIVQDLAVQALVPPGTVLHASTQCAIRTPGNARFHAGLGYGRLVLERQLSLDEVRSIHAAVPEVELEAFVHGALCVCYSGQCYLSEYLTGRSANRGACAQACRSRYDLEDAEGRLLVRNKALLSLRDLQLLHRLEDLAAAGICSFKIEGRLKNETYVRNVVRAYSQALDRLVQQHPDRYRRASYGTVRGGFVPDLRKTFNRGYTTLYIDGTRTSWASMEAATSLGEPVGKVARVGGGTVVLEGLPAGMTLHNGDGFAFVAPGGDVVGFRGDVCAGACIQAKPVEGLRKGMPLYRNVSAAFEKAVLTDRPVREIAVSVALSVQWDGPDAQLSLTACAEDGRRVQVSAGTRADLARDPQRAAETVAAQLGKHSGMYAFGPVTLQVHGPMPFLPAALLNGLRREAAALLDRQPVRPLPLHAGRRDAGGMPPGHITYKQNVANALARQRYEAMGAVVEEPAYEQTHRPGAELMRSRYCVRHELGLCPRQQAGRAAASGPLFLVNNRQRLRLQFDCARCEMTVTEA